MAGFEDTRLFPYYLNSRRLGLLADVNFAVEAQNPLAENSGERVLAMRDVAAMAQQVHRCLAPLTGRPPLDTQHA